MNEHQWLIDLALSFRSVREARWRMGNGTVCASLLCRSDAPDIEAVLDRLASWAGKASSSEREIVSFLLTVWNGNPAAWELEPFNVACVARWDREHQQAFAAWAANPRTA